VRAEGGKEQWRMRAEECAARRRENGRLHKLIVILTIELCLDEVDDARRRFASSSPHIFARGEILSASRAAPAEGKSSLEVR